MDTKDNNQARAMATDKRELDYGDDSAAEFGQITEFARVGV